MTAATAVPVALWPAPSARDAVADAVYRFIMGMDTNDVDLLKSAFVPDCTVELKIKSITGLDAFVKEWYEALIAKTDTTHQVTNMRVHIERDGSKAYISALFTSQHFRGGEGTVLGTPRYDTGGKYYAELVPAAGGLWKIQLFKIGLIWKDGDHSIMGH